MLDLRSITDDDEIPTVQILLEEAVIGHIQISPDRKLFMTIDVDHALNLGMNSIIQDSVEMILQAERDNAHEASLREHYGEHYDSLTFD